jgi:Uma2 family endonuclease
MQATRPFAGLRPHRLSRAEYDRMVKLGFFERERVELIHGIVVDMAPIGPSHSDVVSLLTKALLPPLIGRATLRPQSPFLAWDESEPEPDVAIVLDQSYAAEHPDRAFLLIEVSDSSLEYDRDTKAPLYAASGVPEYWIVDVKSRCIEVYSAPVNGRYTNLRRVVTGETLSPAAFPDVVVRVSDLFPGG